MGLESCSFQISVGPKPINSEDGWVRVEYNQVSQPFSFRVARQGGRLRVVGLAIDNNREITSSLLRSIRLGQLLEDFLGEWDEYDQAAFGWFVEDHVNQLDAPAPRARRGNPPGDQELRTFAEVYAAELQRHPRRAMHEVTKKGGHIPMARSTGYRWLNLARERGFYKVDEGDEG